MSQAESMPVEYLPVVTFFELYGAGATTIGEKVAERLGLPFHGQAFSSGAIAGEAEVEESEDRAVLSTVLGLLGGAYNTLESREVVGTQQDKYQLIEDNTRLVTQRAQQGGVIMGRNATVVLTKRPNTLHVLLTGDAEDRVQRAAKRLGISEAESAKRRASEEDLRRQMSKTLYGWDPGLPDRYDMLLNTSRISVDAAVDAIVDATRRNA